MRYILLIFSVFLFSLTVISCKSSDDDDLTSSTSSTSSTGLFVTVGDNGIILTSSDGISWTKRTSGTTKNLYGVTYGGGLFVTVGDNGTILTSSDGTTWANTSTNERTTLGRYFSQPDANHLYGVTYGDGLFVTVGGDATIFTSSNGTTWTERDGLRSKWVLPQYFKAITYRKKLFVLVGRNGRTLNSPDGITWKQRKSGTKYNLVGITYSPSCGKAEWKGLDAGLCKNGIFVSVGKNGRILTSFDGNWWVKRTFKLPEWLYAVTYGNGTFVTVGVNGVIITSFDGISWTKRASGDQIKSTDIASVRNTGGDLEIRSTGHGLDVGDVIRFTTDGALPTGLYDNLNYYVVGRTTNTFFVSLSSGGDEVVFTNIGNGTHSWQRATYPLTRYTDILDDLDDTLGDIEIKRRVIIEINYE